ncbi:MAG: peroxiredoxin-like family protein [Anaerolineae bacterium]
MMNQSLDTLVAAAEERWLEAWLAGPTRLTWSSLPPQVGEPAPDATVQDLEGKPVALSRFWQEKPLLLVFTRQYGCGCGAERAARLKEEYAEYVAAGAEVIAVGQGKPPRSKWYIQHFDLPCVVLSDPECRAYEAFGLVEGQPSQILPDFDWHPGDLENGQRLLEARREMGRPLVDNPWLLPGEFVIDTRGIIRYAHRYQYCEDHPPKINLLAGIKAAQ